MKYVKPLALFHDLLKTRATAGGRLLGLDVGDKYVGLAISDAHNKIASPLNVLLRKQSNIDLMAIDFQKLVSELSLKGFVFGNPSDREKNSPTALQVKLLIDDLTQTGRLDSLKYTYWNENFTSKIGQLFMKPFDLHPVHAKSIVDKFAAVEILQGYLDFVNRKSEVQPLA